MFGINVSSGLTKKAEPPPTKNMKQPTTPAINGNRQRRLAPATCYAAHIARLQDQNRLLAECLSDERRLRKQAYKWYQERLHSKWWCLIDMCLLSVRHNEKS